MSSSGAILGHCEMFVLVNFVAPMQNFICLDHVYPLPFAIFLCMTSSCPGFLHHETSFVARLWTFSVIILSFLYRRVVVVCVCGGGGGGGKLV